MPALRQLPERRSQRLCVREPTSYESDDYAWEDVDHAFPDNSGRDTVATSASFAAAVSELSLSGPVDDISLILEAPFTPSASHARRRKAGHVPRPPNAFMIFRSDLWRKRKSDPSVERDHRNISVIAGMLWKQLSPEEQGFYRLRATLEKERHAHDNPGYKYTPVVRKQKTGKKKTRADVKNEAEKCKAIASLWMKDFDDPACSTPEVSDGSDLLPSIIPPWSFSTPVLPALGPPSTVSTLSFSTPTVAASTTPTLSGALTEVQTPRQPTFSLPYLDEFVPTDQIPPLDLSNTMPNEERPKIELTLGYNPNPPKIPPNGFQLPFAIKAHSKLPATFILSMNQSFSLDDSEFSLGSSQMSNVDASTSNADIGFGNPFDPHGTFVDTSLSAPDSFEMYHRDVIPTDPTADSSAEIDSWINWD